jgi:HK97 family phage major capsid protein
LGAGTSDAQQLLLSLPVIVNNAIDDHASLVIDSRAVVSAVGTVQVATSTDAYFAADSVGYRVTWRIGHAVPRPNRLGKFNVAATGGP